MGPPVIALEGYLLEGRRLVVEDPPRLFGRAAEYVSGLPVLSISTLSEAMARYVGSPSAA